MRIKLLLSGALLSYLFVFSQSKIEYIDYEDITKSIHVANEQKEYEAIVEYTNKINKNDSVYNSFLLTKSFYLIQLKKYDEVIKVTDEGLSNPKSINKHSFMINKGLALASLNKYQEAIDLYDEGLIFAPKSNLLLYNKGIALEGLKKYDEAVKVYKESIKLNPFYPRAHLRLGSLCLKQGKTAQALMCVNMYLLLNPDGEDSFPVLNSINETVSGNTNEGEIPNFKTSVDDDSFEEIDLILNGRIALNSKYKIDNDITIAYVKQNHALFEQLKDYKGNGGFWDTSYVPFYKWIYENGHFNNFVYTTSYSIKNPKLKKIVEKKTDDVIEFIKIYKPIWTNIINKNTIVFNGKEQLVTYYFYENSLSGIGAMKNGESIGYWEFYDEDGKLLTIGNYNDAGKRMGEWKWFDGLGEIDEKGIYIDGELDGLYQEYFSDGKLKYAYNYKNGVLNGEYKAYNNKGALIEQKTFVDGKLNGTYYSFYGVGESIKEYIIPYKNDEIDGLAVQFHPNGNTYYEANFKNGKRINGVEKKYYINKQLLSEANYLDDEYNGSYKSYYSNGNMYEEGQMLEGLNTGNWKTYYADGTLNNESIYEKGQIQGVYKEYSEKGKPYYEFLYRNDNIIAYKYFNEEGNIIKEAKKKAGEFKYEGHAVNGNKVIDGIYDIDGGKEGIWSYYSDNGVLTSSGNYSNNKKIGEHKYYYGNGKLDVISNYKNDTITGYYVKYYKNGTISRQGWHKNDKAHGEWHYYYPDGTISGINYFHKGKLHGKQKVFTVDGKLNEINEFDYGDKVSDQIYDVEGNLFEEIKYLHNQPEFTRNLTHFNNKSYSKLSYLNGVIHGSYIEFDFYGNKVQEGNYLNGKTHGKRTWYYSDGTIESEAEFLNGDSHGKQTNYFENGSVEDTYFYQFGKLEGACEFYNAEGILIGVNNYKEGKLHGKRTFYSPSGKLQIIRFYENGKIIGYSYLNKEGKELPMIPIINETGKLVSYFDNGNISREMEIENGFWINSYKSYYYSGQLFKEHNNVDNETQGHSLIYYSNGIIKEDAIYNYGLLHGLRKKFYQNGKTKEETNFLNDEKSAEANYYNEEGKLVKKEYFFNGRIYKVENY